MMTIWKDTATAILVGMSALSLSQCTSPNGHKTSDTWTTATSSGDGEEAALGGEAAELHQHQQPTSARELAATPPPADPCRRFSPSFPAPPSWLHEDKLVITRLISECVTGDGHKGYHTDSSWVAMGFPCTGGNGKLDVVGNRYAPKVISFILATDCPMLPSSAQAVTDIGQKRLGLTPAAKLLAYNPFAVQYWEVPGLSDANVGFTVDLRSVEGKQRVWQEFIEQKPIAVKLYGRENAWVLGHHFYYADAELMYVGPTTFKLVVKAVKPLNDEDLKEVQGRCEALRPRRNCHIVFN